MSALILLLCSLPPVAVLAVALVHSLRAESSTGLSVLALSGMLLSAAVVLPQMGDDEPVQSIRFMPLQGGGVATVPDTSSAVRVARRTDPPALYR